MKKNLFLLTFREIIVGRGWVYLGSRRLRLSFEVAPDVALSVAEALRERMAFLIPSEVAFVADDNVRVYIGLEADLAQPYDSHSTLFDVEVRGISCRRPGVEQFSQDNEQWIPPHATWIPVKRAYA